MPLYSPPVASGLTLVGAEHYQTYDVEHDDLVLWPTTAHSDAGDGDHDILTCWVGATGVIPSGTANPSGSHIGRPWDMDSHTVIGEPFLTHDPNWALNSWNGDADAEDWTNVFTLPHGFYKVSIMMTVFGSDNVNFMGAAYDYNRPGTYIDVYDGPAGDVYYGGLTYSSNLVNFPPAGVTTNGGNRRYLTGSLILSDEGTYVMDGGGFAIYPPDTRSTQIGLTIYFDIERYL